MAEIGPKEEVLGGEEQAEKAKAFDENVHRVIDRAAGIPDHFKKALHADYDDKDTMGGLRDYIHERIGDALRVSRMLRDHDPESSAIHAVLKDRVREIQQTLLFANYLTLMEELGHEPVDPEEFAKHTPARRKAHNQKKIGMSECIRTRFEWMRDENMHVGSLVSRKSDSSRHKTMHSIQDILPDGRVVLSGRDWGEDPRFLRVEQA